MNPYFTTSAENFLSGDHRMEKHLFHFAHSLFETFSDGALRLSHFQTITHDVFLVLDINVTDSTCRTFDLATKLNDQAGVLSGVSFLFALLHLPDF